LYVLNLLRENDLLNGGPQGDRTKKKVKTKHVVIDGMRQEKKKKGRGGGGEGYQQFQRGGKKCLWPPPNQGGRDRLRVQQKRN